MCVCVYMKAHSAEPPPCQGVLRRGVQHLCGESVPLWDDVFLLHGPALEFARDFERAPTGTLPKNPVRF